MNRRPQSPVGSKALHKTGHVTFHLTPVAIWESSREESFYVPETFVDEGFIHCTDSIQEVIAVGNRYYRDDPRPYLLLEIACEQVHAPIVYEDPGQIFPHIYGNLETAAVMAVRSVVRESGGAFLAVE